MFVVITLARLHPLGSRESGNGRPFLFVALHPEAEADVDPSSLRVDEEEASITPAARSEEARRESAEREKANTGPGAGGGVGVGSAEAKAALQERLGIAIARTRTKELEGSLEGTRSASARRSEIGDFSSSDQGYRRGSTIQQFSREPSCEVRVGSCVPKSLPH